MAKAKAGDRAAFDAVVAAERRRLEAFVRQRLGSRLRAATEVEDILQETCLRAYRALDRFEWRGPDSVFGWLGSIAEFFIRDLARAGGRNPLSGLRGDVPGSGASPSKALRRGERFERLKKALESLAEDHRAVIQLARLDGLSTTEIARRLGRSPGAVRHLLLRALEKLRGAFGDTESLHLPDRRLSDE
jgi:RNA polymerase sigma-70 factor (ECF subfamily)